jgi:addiction module RelB/DinJ family antitoxin
MNTTILNIKTDKALKSAAQETAKELGVPLSTIVNAFLKQFVRDQEVTYSTKQHRMTAYLEGLVRDAQAEYAAGITAGPFTDPQDLIASLKS